MTRISEIGLLMWLISCKLHHIIQNIQERLHVYYNEPLELPSNTASAYGVPQRTGHLQAK